MDNSKIQLSEKLQAATNILVTVSSDPSVDQLAACIGMTLWLNKIGKHATAVFSGQIPNALEFLQPEATIEKDTNSLRDFIIALDKSKADKLRYKVEDQVVKIFITPFRTSLSSKDLEYSQGDFNVDAIVAIGVSAQEDLDNAIISHGRILHDAVVTTITTNQAGQLGSVNWYEPTASSLSELVYEECMLLDAKQIDPQIATALMTGIVAETSRFSNNKTSSQTMSMAAALMAAGANQQLVATKLEEAEHAPAPEPPEVEEEVKEEEIKTDVPIPASDGSLEINHPDSENQPVNDQELSVNEELGLPPIAEEPVMPEQPLDDQPVLGDPTSDPIDTPIAEEPTPSRRIMEPPTLGGRLNASDIPDDQIEESVNPLNLPPVEQELLSRQPQMPSSAVEEPKEQILNQLTPTNDQPDIDVDLPIIHAPEEPSSVEPADQQTLQQIETAVESPHLDSIRDQVLDALKSGPLPEPEKRADLNAGGNLEINPPIGTGAQPDIAVNPLAFDHTTYEVKEIEDEKNEVPQVPPPIVPPSFLPPSPPIQ